MKWFGGALALAAGLALVVSGCEADDGGGGAAALVTPEEALSWPEVRHCRMSIEHDAQHITVTANPSSAQAYTDGVYPFEPGTVIVKPLFDDAGCSELSGFAVMRRLDDGASPEGKDWEWQSLDADGNVLESGALAKCVSCHAACTEGRDMACTDP